MYYSLAFKGSKILHCTFETFTFIFLFLTFSTRFISNDPVSLALCNIALLIVGFPSLGVAIRSNNRKIGLIIFASLICWLIELLGRDGWNYRIEDYICSLAYLGVAYSFIYLEKSAVAYKLFYYFVVGFILIKVLVLKIPIRDIMQYKASYNYISITCLFYLLLLNFLQWKQKEDFSYIPAILFLVITVISYGRGGIITGLFYLVGLIAVKTTLARKTIKIIFLQMFSFGVLVIACYYLYDYLLETRVFDKFAVYGFTGNGREIIWSTFINSCTSSIPDFIFGGNPLSAALPGDEQANLHNSFLQLYASFGLLFFVMMMFFFVEKIIRAIGYKDYWMLLIIGTFTVRAFTDLVMYRSFCEIIFYIILLSGGTKYFFKPKRDLVKNEL